MKGNGSSSSSSLLVILSIDEIRTYSLSAMLAQTARTNSPTTPNPISSAHNLSPSRSCSYPQCCRSPGLLKFKLAVVPFLGASATNTYLCFPVLGGGPGDLYGITSSNRFVCCEESSSSVLSSGLAKDTSVAIQWQISLHSGLSRDGASGSDIAIVSCGVFSLVVQRLGTASMNLSLGCFCVLEGLIVLPYSASASDQDTETVSRGLKESITVGMISAFFSLGLVNY